MKDLIVFYVAPAFVSICVFETLSMLRVGHDARRVVSASLAAMVIMRSRDIEEEEKERVARRRSVDILIATVHLSIKFGLVGAFVYLLFLVFVRIFPGNKADIVESALSPISIVCMSVSVAFYAWVRKVGRGKGDVLR